MSEVKSTATTTSSWLVDTLTFGNYQDFSYYGRDQMACQSLEHIEICRKSFFESGNASNKVSVYDTNIRVLHFY